VECLWSEKNEKIFDTKGDEGKRTSLEFPNYAPKDKRFDSKVPQCYWREFEPCCLSFFSAILSFVEA
jgi:hypothetical protein